MQQRAGQHALLHGLLRFQIELGAAAHAATSPEASSNVTCGDGNIVTIIGDDPQCLC